MEVTHLFAGKPQAFGPRKSPSSIIKQPYPSLQIDLNGAIEDEQGNKKLHGGPEMALHQYAQSSYITLQNTFPKTAYKMHIGSIGENISAPDMNDDNVCIGDIYRLGETVLQVSSPRAPCSKINHRYGQQKIDLHILELGICGWYFRVLEVGTMHIGDSIKLEHRNQEAVSIKTLMHMTKPPKNMHFEVAHLEHAMTSEGLAPEWQAKLKRIIAKSR